MSGALRKAISAVGARPTMPAKMMKLMPLPMPFSVISSPSHMSRTEPVVRATIWTSVVEVGQAERAGQDRWVRVVEQGQEAVRLEQGQRHGQVAGVLVDLVPAVLALAAQRLEPRDDARHQLHDDRGVDVRVHAEPDDREARQAAAREQVEQAEQRVAAEERAPAPSGRRPGTGTWARNRKTTRIPATNRSRRRRSGARKALSRFSITVRRLRRPRRRRWSWRSRRPRPRSAAGASVAAFAPAAWRPWRPCALAGFGLGRRPWLQRSPRLGARAGLASAASSDASAAVVAPSATAVGSRRPRRPRSRSWRPRPRSPRAGSPVGRSVASVGAASTAAPRPGRPRSGVASAAGSTPERRQRSRSGSRAPGPSRRPPRSWPTALLLNASATTNSADLEVALAEDLHRLVERPDEADRPEELLVDRDRRRPWPALRAGQLARLERAEQRRARRSGRR